MNASSIASVTHRGALTHPSRGHNPYRIRGPYCAALVHRQQAPRGWLGAAHSKAGTPLRRAHPRAWAHPRACTVAPVEAPPRAHEQSTSVTSRAIFALRHDAPVQPRAAQGQGRRRRRLPPGLDGVGERAPTGPRGVHTAPTFTITLLRRRAPPATKARSTRTPQPCLWRGPGAAWQGPGVVTAMRTRARRAAAMLDGWLPEVPLTGRHPGAILKGLGSGLGLVGGMDGWRVWSSRPRGWSNRDDQFEFLTNPIVNQSYT